MYLKDCKNINWILLLIWTIYTAGYHYAYVQIVFSIDKLTVLLLNHINNSAFIFNMMSIIYICCLAVRYSAIVCIYSIYTYTCKFLEGIFLGKLDILYLSSVLNFV